MECSQTLTPTWTGDGPSPLDLGLAKRVAESLHRHYPGHLWGVRADAAGGMVTVLNMRLSGRWGFMLKMRDLAYEDEIEREAREAGGELLERYGLSRGPFRADEYQQLPSTPLGDLIHDGG
ncbi:MAG: hypothetical protein ACREVJ_10505 [Gammaproteobacteria bacterium]